VSTSNTTTVRDWLAALHPVRFGTVSARMNEFWKLPDDWLQRAEWSGAQADVVLRGIGMRQEE
jgi:hypothetical protein